MNKIVDTAIYYRSIGLSVIPVDKFKAPCIPWKDYQNRMMEEKEIEQAFSLQHVFGIAVVCGEVSRNLEVIDIDAYNDLSTTLIYRFLRKVELADTHLLSKLLIERTRNYGLHILYRCPIIANYRVFARRKATNEELSISPDQKFKTLIESRGRRQYIITAPTPNYRFIHNDIHHIPLIAPSERKLLWHVASGFDELATTDPRPEPKVTVPRGDLTSPFNDYDFRGDVIDLLKRHGWLVVGRDQERTILKRPGDTTHKKSGDFHHKLGILTLFTPNTVFIPYKGYRPYSIYAILECNGDYQEAARRLIAKGYGVAYNKR